MRDFLLKILFRELYRALLRLRNKLYYYPTMSLNTEEAVTIVEAAGNALDAAKKAVTDALAAIAPLQAENATLKESVEQLEAADASVDAAIEGLRAKLPVSDPVPEIPAEPVEEPVEEPVAEPTPEA